MSLQSSRTDTSFVVRFEADLSYRSRRQTVDRKLAQLIASSLTISRGAGLVIPILASISVLFRWLPS